MNKFRFLQTMQLIDDEFLEEAYVPIRRKSRKWHTSIAIAACIVLFIGIGAWNMISSLNRVVTIIVSEYGFMLELPDNAKNVTHQIIGGDTDIPMLEASFSVDEQVYLCRMVNTEVPTDITSAEGITVSMMNWQTSDLSFQYRQQDEYDSWLSWYDAEADIQWCLSGQNPVALLTTAETLVQKLGYSMAVVPDGAEKVSYKAIGYQDFTVGETSFVWDDVQYAYRMASTMKIEEYFADISDAVLFGEEYATEVLWCPARITIDETGHGKIVWFDVVPGLLYSLTMDSNASEDTLLEMAHLLFEPAQESNP